MSFDLYFCVRSGQTVPPPLELEAFLTDRERVRMEASNDTMQAFYENEDTGVYCILDIYRSQQPDEEEIVPSGFVGVPLAFNLNFCRPSFFARETMPIVQSVAEHFSLLVIDPQGDETPTTASLDALISSWERSNESAVRSLFAQQQELREETGYLAHADAGEWWEYQFAKSRLELAEPEDDVFVPHIMLMRAPGSRQVLRTITWSQGVHRMIIPRADYVAMVPMKQSRLRGLRPSGEIRVIEWQAMRQGLSESLHDVAGQLPLQRLELVGDPRESFSRLYSGAPALESIGLSGIASDRFVDVEA